MVSPEVMILFSKWAAIKNSIVSKVLSVGRNITLASIQEPLRSERTPAGNSMFQLTLNNVLITSAEVMFVTTISNYNVVSKVMN